MELPYPQSGRAPVFSRSLRSAEERINHIRIEHIYFHFSPYSDLEIKLSIRNKIN
jgi:hypothetical protein